jgi:hypothetical protein
MLLNIFLLYLVTSRSPYATHTLGGKEEWANLQSVYYSETEQNVTKIIEKYGNKYLFIYRKSGSIFVLLNCKFPPYYKQFPHDKGFMLNQEEFSLLSEVNNLTPTVKFVLLSHLK